MKNKMMVVARISYRLWIDDSLDPTVHVADICVVQDPDLSSHDFMLAQALRKLVNEDSEGDRVEISCIAEKMTATWVCS